MTAFLLGVGTGALLLVVFCLLVSHLADRPDRREARVARAQQERAAFRDWCERVGWCPVHDADDGTCPRVEVSVYEEGRPAYRYEDCPGSAVLRSPAKPTPTGTVLERDGGYPLPTRWEYTAPEHCVPGSVL